MGKLIVNPETKEVFFWQPGSDKLHQFGGPQVDKPAEATYWPTVNQAPVHDPIQWGANPGAFGPAYITAQIEWFRDGVKLEDFTVGGSWLCVQNWLGDRVVDGDIVRTHWLACYTDRNAARANADVQW